MWTYEGIKRDLLNEGYDVHHDSALRKLSFIVIPEGRMPYECYTHFSPNDQRVMVQLFHNFPGIVLSAIFEKDRALYRRLEDICESKTEEANNIIVFGVGFTKDNERFYIYAVTDQNYVKEQYKDKIYSFAFFKEILILMMTIHEAISNQKI